MALLRTELADVMPVPPRAKADAISLGLPLGGHLALVSTLTELEGLKDAWQSLEASSGASHGVFQSFEWCSAWSRIYAQGQTELAVITGYDKGKLAFVFPLMKTTEGGISMLRWLSEPFGQYGDVVIADDQDARRWLAGAWALIKTFKDVDLIRLRHVREDSKVRGFLAEAFRSAKSRGGAPCLDLAQYATQEAYDGRYSKEQRRRRKRIRKELEERGPVEFRLLDGLCQDKAIRDALAEKQKWIDERALWSRALACPRLLEFLHELRRSSGRNMRLVTSFMSAGKEPISWEIGLRFKDRHCGFITSHRADLTDASPARLHMDLSQRQALKDGMKTFDLMVPCDAHKASWSDRVIPVQDYYAATSARGWLNGVLYFEFIRPVLRHIYYRAPEPLRHFMTGLAKLKRSILT